MYPYPPHPASGSASYENQEYSPPYTSARGSAYPEAYPLPPSGVSMPEQYNAHPSTTPVSYNSPIHGGAYPNEYSIYPEPPPAQPSPASGTEPAMAEGAEGGPDGERGLLSKAVFASAGYLAYKKIKKYYKHSHQHGHQHGYHQSQHSNHHFGRSVDGDDFNGEYVSDDEQGQYQVQAPCSNPAAFY